jgi:hypothetical protein
VVTGSTSEKASAQWQYLDVGVNISARLSAADGDWMNFDCSLDVSSVIPSEQSQGGLTQPLLRQSRQELHAVIHPEKPTIVATLDDVNSTRTMQVEVTATRQK